MSKLNSESATKMSANPYEPPNAEVADLPATCASPTHVPVFFPTSMTKLLVLTFCTLGVYEYYWFYKNWKLIRDRTSEDISPFWRTFFAVFYCYQLFDRVRKQTPDPARDDLPAGFLATVWIILTILWKLPDPYWLLSFLAVLALLPVQQTINRINQAAAPGHDTNARFSVWNWIAVCLGGPFFLLAAYGSFLPNH